MKYALVHKTNKAIRSVQDEEFSSVPSDLEQVAITAQQAIDIEASSQPLFLFEGELKQASQMYACLNKDKLTAEIRTKRNNLLAACDWTQAIDSPLSESKKAEWAEYRQLLRDIPEAISEGSVDWPTKPE